MDLFELFSFWRTAAFMVVGANVGHHTEAVKAEGIQLVIKLVEMRELVQRAYFSLFLLSIPLRSYLGT